MAGRKGSATKGAFPGGQGAWRGRGALQSISMALFVLGGAVPCFPSIPSNTQQCAGSSRWQLWDCHQGGDTTKEGTTTNRERPPKRG